MHSILEKLKFVIYMGCNPFLNQIDQLKFKYKYRQLIKEEDKLCYKYKNLIKEAKSDDKKELLRGVENSEFFLIQDKIDILVTSYLCGRAIELFIPLPDRKDKSLWREQPPCSGQYVLTPKGIARMRADIRQEKRELREPLITLLPLLIGLIGAICALITIIKS